ncbi:hypothetical protein MBT84_12825 [Streptomyces sp. MBT84]|nr:hypothetical protein [Streptomyces sp. MBT84]
MGLTARRPIHAGAVRAGRHPGPDPALTSTARQWGHTGLALRPYRQVSPWQRVHGPICSGEQPSTSAADTRSVVGAMRLGASSICPNVASVPASADPARRAPNVVRHPACRTAGWSEVPGVRSVRGGASGAGMPPWARPEPRAGPDALKGRHKGGVCAGPSGGQLSRLRPLTCLRGCDGGGSEAAVRIGVPPAPGGLGRAAVRSVRRSRAGGSGFVREGTTRSKLGRPRPDVTHSPLWVGCFSHLGRTYGRENGSDSRKGVLPSTSHTFFTPSDLRGPSGGDAGGLRCARRPAR